MKLLKAIIRPNKVEDGKDALSKLNISGMPVTEVRGQSNRACLRVEHLRRWRSPA